MKQLLIAVIAILLFTKCNNNSGWSVADRQKGLKLCMDEVGTNLDDATAKKYCSCVIEKAQQKYKNFTEANNGTEADGTKMGQSCMKELALGGAANADNDTKGKNGGGLFGAGNDNNGKNKTAGDEENDGGGVGNGWSNTDKTTFLTPCKNGLVGHGYNAAQADKLCSCVLEKIEKKYRNLKEANEQGGEAAGSKAMQECFAETGGGDN